MNHEIIDETHQPKADKKQPLIGRVKQEWSVLAKLGAPILVAQLAQMANGVIDVIMAGRASADDLTGVAIGNSLWTPLFLFMLGVLGASQPIISSLRGEGSHHKIVPVTWSAIYIGICAALISILALTNIGPVLALLNMEAKPEYITVGYLQAFVWGIPALFLLLALRGLTDGLGHTKTFMAFSILTACINAPLNYAFIYGKFGAPELGGIGCGWATAISMWVTVILYLVYLNFAKAFQNFHLWRHRIQPNLTEIKAFLSLGIPIGFTIFVESTMFAVIALLLASFGSHIVAGHQIAINVVSVMFMVPLSLGMALTLRISFLMGAKDKDSANLVAKSSLILVLIIAFFYAGILVPFAETLAGFYSTEQDVIDVAVVLLGYGAMFQIADVIQVNSISALRGFKDTKIPMLIMVSSFWGIGIPLGYILAKTDWLFPAMGAAGFWIGLIAGLTNAAFWLTLRLFRFSRVQR
ncbi:MATE family efflux transporter [Reinekea marina]|uniref:Multidrug-efflux transporter n=1 Tax=Reinekea marina TaxID=1310421 RepID=A0ABV7WQ86_9GAMM|nr:MATE family efflux transporter [Reinekea marina]MDN3650240.1 MATE family efflux transporter [Reinekea marina]